MRFFVVNKKQIIYGVLAILAIIGIIMSSGKAITTFLVGGRDIPIYSVERDDNAIALTFDCAWNDDDIDEIIKILKDNNSTATFFVTGKWAEDYSDSLNKLWKNGFEIGMHSYNHDDYTKMSREEILEDIKKCKKSISRVTGESPDIVRVPSGAYNNRAVRTIEDNRMWCIQWSVDGIDYVDTTPDEIYERVVPILQTGDIILLHNGTEHTKNVLPRILRDIKGKYKLVNVSDLIYKEHFTLDHTGRQQSKTDLSI